MPGHLRRNCRKWLASQRVEGSARTDDTTRSDEARAQTAQSDERAVAFTVGGGGALSPWIIDSGASTHVTGDRSFFSKLTEFDGGWISVANGEKMQIRGEGCGVLYAIDDKEERVKINMSGVLFVPGLTTSLISVERLAQKKLKVMFEDEGCKVYDSKGVVATAVRSGGLYRLRVGHSAMSVAHGVTTEQQWHRHLGRRDCKAADRLLQEERLKKGYRFLDRKTGRIIVSRNTRFRELSNGSSSAEIPSKAPAPEGRRAVAETVEFVFREEKKTKPVIAEEVVKEDDLPKVKSEVTEEEDPLSATMVEAEEEDATLVKEEEEADPLSAMPEEPERAEDRNSDESEYHSMIDSEDRELPPVRKSSRMNFGAIPKRFGDYVLDLSVEEPLDLSVSTDDELDTPRDVKRDELGPVAKCENFPIDGTRALPRDARGLGAEKPPNIEEEC